MDTTGETRTGNRGRNKGRDVYVNGRIDPRLFRRDDSPKVYYRGPDPEGSGKSRIVSTKTIDPVAAQLVANDLERRAADPDYRAAKSVSLKRAINDFIANMEVRQLRPKTITKNKGLLGVIAGRWGEAMPIHKIDHSLVTAYIAARLKDAGSVKGSTLSTATVGMELDQLRGMLKLMMRLGLYSRPLETVFPAFSKTGRKVTRFPTMEEAPKLLNAITDPAFRGKVAYCLATGARHAEMLRARRSWHRFEEGVIEIDGTKTKLVRTVAREIPVSPLTEPLVLLALSLAPGNDGDPDLLFRQASPSDDNKRLKVACARASIQDLSFNDLRRAYASWHAASGVTSSVGHKLLRHATTREWETTYANLRGGSTIGKLLRAELDSGKIKGLLAMPTVRILCGDADANQSSEVPSDETEGESPQETAIQAQVATASHARNLGRKTSGEALDIAQESTLTDPAAVRNLCSQAIAEPQRESGDSALPLGPTVRTYPVRSAGRGDDPSSRGGTVDSGALPDPDAGVIPCLPARKAPLPRLDVAQAADALEVLLLTRNLKDRGCSA